MPLFLIVTHFVADWVLQSNWMALNKSKNWIALYFHVLVYTAAFATALLIAGRIGFIGAFTAITFITHFVTDAITSRITSKLWFFGQVAGGVNEFYIKEPNTRYWFFVMIGLDQLIHYVTLAWTWRYLGGV